MRTLSWGAWQTPWHPDKSCTIQRGTAAVQQAIIPQALSRKQADTTAPDSTNRQAVRKLDEDHELERH